MAEIFKKGLKIPDEIATELESLCGAKSASEIEDWVKSLIQNQIKAYRVQMVDAEHTQKVTRAEEAKKLAIEAVNKFDVSQITFN